MSAVTTPSASQGVAWIAGVGTGLGAALARRYAAGGLTVALTGRSLARLDAIAADIRASGGHAVAIEADLADEAAVQRAAARVVALGPLRAAVFNAAESVRGGLLEVSAADFEKTMRGGPYAAFLFARESVKAMLASAPAADQAHGLGSLIFTGATASLRGGAKFAAFASAKAALRSLAQSVARDFGPQGIHVAHVVIDGGIDSERVRANFPQRVVDAGVDGLLEPDAIAEAYWQVHLQHRSAWTHELDLRPFKERF